MQDWKNGKEKMKERERAPRRREQWRRVQWTRTIYVAQLDIWPVLSNLCTNSLAHKQVNVPVSPYYGFGLWSYLSKHDSPRLDTGHKLARASKQTKWTLCPLVVVTSSLRQFPLNDSNKFIYISGSLSLREHRVWWTESVKWSAPKRAPWSEHGKLAMLPPT